MVRYVFKEDAVLTIKGADKADPQKIGEALAAISDKAGGHLTPDAVVAAARERRSPLHRHFEWDDATAAEKYRVDQARSLIRSVHLSHEDSEDGMARAFLSVREKGGTSYRALADVLNSADLQRRVLDAAERDLLSFETRYKSLSDICNLIRQ